MYNREFSYKALLPNTLVVLGALISGLAIVKGQKAGIMLCIAPFMAWFVLKDKRNILYLFLLLLPFFAVPYFSTNLMGIPGAKPVNLIGAILSSFFFLYGGSLLKNKDPIEKKAMFVLLIYFAVFSLALFRSLGYLHILCMFDPDNFHNNPLRYLLSAYIRPSLFIIPFIYVLKHMKTREDIQQCIDVICYAIFILSCAVVAAGLLNIGTVTSGRHGVNEVISAFFGMHYNSVGSIYIIVVPLLVLHIVQKKKLGIANFVLSAIAVGLLQSRSTIAVYLCGTVLVLYFTNKKFYLITFLGIFVLISLYWLPDFLVQALSTNIDTGDANKIFTGRIDSIWMPLILERLNNPGEFWFGVGRFSMMTSPLYLSGDIYQANSAHNAFVEFFIDNGIILFSGLVIFFVLFLKKGWNWAKKINTPIAWSLFACIITYLVGTISGRKVYPDHHNMYLFPVIALYLNYIRLYLKGE